MSNHINDNAGDGSTVLLNEALSQIRKKQRKSKMYGRSDAYEKQDLLQLIYTVYCNWPRIIRFRIKGKLAERLDEKEPDVHLLELLIREALPNVSRSTANAWAVAIQYGESCHVRPHKLRAFFFVKGGLVRCAHLFPNLEQSAEDDDEEEQDRRRMRQRQDRRLKPPPGFIGLFDH